MEKMLFRSDGPVLAKVCANGCLVTKAGDKYLSSCPLCGKKFDYLDLPTEITSQLLSVSFEEYENIPAVRFTHLKELQKSKLHYQTAVQGPKEDKQSFLVGRAVHAAIFEPTKFAQQYVVWKGTDRKGLMAFKAVHEKLGKTVLKAELYEDVIKMRDAVRKNRYVKALLENGRPEITATWKDRNWQVACKARIDYLNGVFMELKTIRSADTDTVTRSILNYHYDAQAMFYQDGLATNNIHATPIFVFVEKAAPYDVVVVDLDEKFLDFGREKVHNWFSKLCSDEPISGRFEEPQRILLPKWAKRVNVTEEEADVDVGLEGEE